MDNLKNVLLLENLNSAKTDLVPHVLTSNYYNILKMKLSGKRLTNNEQYYYNHYIKKKLKGMFKLFNIGTGACINGREHMNPARIEKASKLLNRYSKKHKGMKVLISGSFLYRAEYNDIDIFVLSKYDKEDYREGKVHVNYIPAGVENTLFFQSLSRMSVSNFKFSKECVEDVSIESVFELYEYLILLMLQKDDHSPELRDLVLKLEYLSTGVILNSMQLNNIVGKITKSRNKMIIINKQFIAKIICAYSFSVLRTRLKRFIASNRMSGKTPANWKIYNETYREILKIVTS